MTPPPLNPPPRSTSTAHSPQLIGAPPPMSPALPRSQSSFTKFSKRRRKGTDLTTQVSLRAGSNKSLNKSEMLGSLVEVVDADGQTHYRYLAIETMGFSPLMKSLTNVEIYNNKQEVVDTLAYGEVVAIEQWQFKKIAGSRMAVANVIVTNA